jgi:hypothetical protein
VIERAPAVDVPACETRQRECSAGPGGALGPVAARKELMALLGWFPAVPPWQALRGSARGARAHAAGGTDQAALTDALAAVETASPRSGSPCFQGVRFGGSSLGPGFMAAYGRTTDAGSGSAA